MKNKFEIRKKYAVIFALNSNIECLIDKNKLSIVKNIEGSIYISEGSAPYYFDKGKIALVRKLYNLPVRATAFYKKGKLDLREQSLCVPRNEYIIGEETSIIRVKRNNGRYAEVLVDTEDVEKIKALDYLLFILGDTGHVVFKQGDKIIYLHQYLTGEVKNLYIAHKDGDILNCCKSNLAHVEKINKSLCRKKPNKNNKNNNFRGVFSFSNNRYMVSIGYNRKKVYLGIYHNYEEAVEVAKRGFAFLIPVCAEAQEILKEYPNFKETCKIKDKNIYRLANEVYIISYKNTYVFKKSFYEAENFLNNNEQ